MKSTESAQEPNQRPQSSLPSTKRKVVILGVEFLVDQCYELQKLIGKGTYGVVASGVNKLTGQTVAIKKMSDIFLELGDTKRILREITILKFLKHKNIISLVDILSVDDPNEFKDLYLVFQLMATNLGTVINQVKQIQLDDIRIKTLIYQLLHGIHYMHSADIIHRDLKPQNLLVSKKCDLKIGDLNLAKKCQQEDDRTGYVVTRWYRAPEVLLFSSSYTKAIDIWSAGCILAELIGRTILFKGQDYMDQLMRIVAVMGHPSAEDFEGDALATENLTTLLKSISGFSRGKIRWQQLFKNANPLSLDLLDSMLVYNPKKRFTVQQCLNHPYLREQFLTHPPEKCNDVMDWSFDNLETTEQVLRAKILQQVANFHSQKCNEPCLKREAPSTLDTEQQNIRKARKLLNNNG